MLSSPHVEIHTEERREPAQPGPAAMEPTAAVQLPVVKHWLSSRGASGGPAALRRRPAPFTSGPGRGPVRPKPRPKGPVP